MFKIKEIKDYIRKLFAGKQEQTVHPEFLPIHVFNDSQKSQKAYLKSYLKTDPLFKMLKATGHPYYKTLEISESVEGLINVVIPKGGNVKLPHSRYLNMSKNVLTIRGENEL